MKDPCQEYRAALADFSTPGERWNAKGRLTYWGKAAGLTADEIVADARAAGVNDRDADIRRGWNDAKPKGDRPLGGWRRDKPRARPRPAPTHPRFVGDLVAAGGGEAASADILALSPLAVPTGGAGQTAAFLRALFAPADFLHIFRDDSPTRGVRGQSLMPCRDWLATAERGGAMPGDLIVPNPFTGETGETADGKPSLIAQSCIARYPFLVVEFDSMPLKRQAAFWRGLLTASPLAPHVAALTYSGGKSIHGVLHVGCRTLAEWNAARGRVRGLLAASPDPSLRADEQAMRPRTGTRLPGVRRFGNGRAQGLLYLNPEAVRAGTGGATVRPAPREAASTRAAAQTGDGAALATERATGRISANPRDSAPPPSRMPDGMPLDDLLALFDTRESAEAAGQG